MGGGRLGGLGLGLCLRSGLGLGLGGLGLGLGEPLGEGAVGGGRLGLGLRGRLGRLDIPARIRLPAIARGRGGQLWLCRLHRYAEPSKVLHLVLGKRLATRAHAVRLPRGLRHVGAHKRTRVVRQSGRRIRPIRGSTCPGPHVPEQRLVLRRDRRSSSGSGSLLRPARPLHRAAIPVRRISNAGNRPEIVECDLVVVDPQVKAAPCHEHPYSRSLPPVVAGAVYGHVRVALAHAGRHGHLVDGLSGADLAARVAVPDERCQLVPSVVRRSRHEIVRPLGHVIEPRRQDDRHAGGEGRRGAP